MGARLWVVPGEPRHLVGQPRKGLLHHGQGYRGATQQVGGLRAPHQLLQRLLPPRGLRLRRRRRVRQQQPQRLARRAEGGAPLGGRRGRRGRAGRRHRGRGGAVLLLVRRRRGSGSGSGRGRRRGRTRTVCLHLCLRGRVSGRVSGREAELLQREPGAEQHVPRRGVEARGYLSKARPQRVSSRPAWGLSDLPGVCQTCLGFEPCVAYGTAEQHRRRCQANAAGRAAGGARGGVTHATEQPG